MAEEKHECRHGHTLPENTETSKLEESVRILHIENLDCPVCAEALQSDLQKIKGVRFVRVDYVTQTIALRVDNEESLQKVIKTTNKFESVRVLDEGSEEVGKTKDKSKREWICIGICALLFLVGVIFEYILPWAWREKAAYVLYGAAYLIVGYPVLLSTVKNVSKGRIFDENFLMTVASIGALALGEAGEGVLVMFLYQLGEALQTLAVGSSRRSVAELMELKSERAILLIDGEQKEVNPDALRVGDTVLVKAGEKAPTDGTLCTERAILDVKSLTGESELKQVKRGEEILSGSINEGGMYEMRVLRPYEDSAVGRILDMVENAAAGKAKPEKFIAKFAKFYTPAVCIVALLMAVFAPLVGGWIVGKGFYFQNFSRWVQSALTFLVISCPCALVISVPLTYFSGIGACAKQGILVKGATYLDTVAQAEILAFDKTGTLTEGSFTVRKTRAFVGSERELLAIAAAVEKGSSHPIAKAFAGVETEYLAEEIFERAGRGVTAKIAGERVLVGNEKLLQDEGVSVEKIASAYTLVYVAKAGICLGVIEIGDQSRAEAKGCLEELNGMGFSRLVMLTGDGRERAEQVAQEVGISEVKAALLPDEKLLVAEELKKAGGLLYVGDGVNDAPVMMAADCAVSMGKLGSAAAVEASDIVLVSDNLKALPKAVEIARKTRAVVLQNIVFSIVMKVGFMALGAAGVLPLWLAVFADVGVMLLAVCNSFRVRSIKTK